MKKYTVELNNEDQIYDSSTEEKVTELGLILQVWQDLKKLEVMNKELQQEDRLIFNILTQILSSELGGENKINYPDYYAREVTNLNVDAKKE